MARPFWSGQVQISLVSFAVNLFPAVEAKSEIHFHQLSRKTGERVHHQNVTESESSLASDDLVKGYEYKKGKYLAIEPKEIENLRIKSQRTIEIVQFTDLDAIALEYVEKPYFLVPGKEEQAKAFGVMRKALIRTKKVALGKIAFGGREHLIAIAPPSDEKSPGMMAYTLHYADELREPADYLKDVKQSPVQGDELSLALELIKRQSAGFHPEKFTDEYEAALKRLVQAKLHNRPLPEEEAEAKPGKVVNLMDALKQSLQTGRRTTSDGRGQQRRPAAHKGLALVKNKSMRRRKSA